MAYSFSWKNNYELKAALKNYVASRTKREEILDFVQRDFSQYPWSLRSLDRRLAHFGIRYTDYTIPIERIESAVTKEMAGPGALLGYRAMHQKIRQKYSMNVPRDVVHNVMYDANPDLLEERRLQNKKKPRGHFYSAGSNWVWSLDGHDKLMGYQNWTFPLAIYGCIDTASRKILWLKVWDTNSNPQLIGKWHWDYLSKSNCMPNFMRIDKGSETGTMATMQSYLRNKTCSEDQVIDEPCDSVIYGPSTTNQIERWWRELHERLEKFFKEGLVWLKDQHHYDPENEQDRDAMKYVMIPLIQRELDEFKDLVWNTHRIRKQRGCYLPDGIPNHIYSFPEKYDMEKCGFQIKPEQLQEVAELSGILETPEDYLDLDTKLKFTQIIEDPSKIPSQEYVKAYLDVKYLS
ncbi:uncharacterized protein [Clytia hemisphaerica]|uniref:uncharacterized protein n=1 Tax=Clytia hemisphaerica TaxID=252671 RepID=UPI0034D57488